MLLSAIKILLCYFQREYVYSISLFRRLFLKRIAFYFFFNGPTSSEYSEDTLPTEETQ